jgi:protocatechuate 3,4-dioxygenase beta subunit
MVDISRRNVIGALLAAGAVLLAPARALARACRNAVLADEGPFYPVSPFPETSDLIGDRRPPGQLLYLLGRVVDPECRPIAGAVVEIWQCDTGGQYDHPRAPKTKALEPGFRYFAKVRAATDGSFRFRTLRPASYEVSGLKRAPHIHVRVKAPGKTLTTEIYFEGAEDAALRTTDRVFQGRGPRKGELVVPVRPATQFAARLATAPEPGALACEYDLTLA